MSIGTPTVHKDLFLISLVPKWSGSETVVPPEEFSGIEGLARLGRWQESDKPEVAILKLTDSAKLFYSGCPELHTEDVTWQKFKCSFRQRFRDIHADQYHFMKLQTAKQGILQTSVEDCHRKLFAK